MILITGATGTVGRPLVELLHTAGARVRALTRDSAAAGLPDGVGVVEAGAADALDGVTALFLHSRAVRDAAELVALAAINVDDDLTEQPSRFNGDRNKETEDAAVASGLEWTSLRPSSFAANTIGMFGAQLRVGDIVRYVYPDFAESPIHELPPQDVTQRMVAHGFPEPFVTALMARYAKHLDAPQHPPTGEVEKVLGRPARTYAKWVADHAAAFQNRGPR